MKFVNKYFIWSNMKNIDELKIGFIGTGHMGSILIEAVSKKINKNIKEIKEIIKYDLIKPYNHKINSHILIKHQ